MLLRWCNPPRLGSFFKTSPLPGDDVTEPRAGARPLTGTCQASGSVGAGDPGWAVRDPSCLPSLHSRPPAWSPETQQQGASKGQPGGGSVTQSQRPTGLQGGPYPTGGAVVSFFPFFLFFFFSSSWPPTARKPGPPELEREQGGRGAVRRSVPDSTGNVSFSTTAPTRAS